MPNGRDLMKGFNLEKFLMDFGKDKLRSEKETIDILLGQSTIKQPDQASDLMSYLCASEIIYASGRHLASEYGSSSDTYWEKTMRLEKRTAQPGQPEEQASEQAYYLLVLNIYTKSD